MNIIGIIAEYNPFHNGHLYQIKKIKEIYPDSLIIVLLNGCFHERGEISLINKYDKTKICLENNIDLIIELPFVYATQSADIFASGAIQILKNLFIETLVFGTESDNIDNLYKIANLQIKEQKYDKLVKKYINEGINYPTATSKAIYDLLKIKIDKPNDLLALSYIKEIIKQKANITPISIKRTNDYHEKNGTSNIVSASQIRLMINENKDINKYVPNNIIKYINKIDYNTYFKLLKYQIINNINNLNMFNTVDEGIENRIKKYILKSNSLDELINNIKTKRYTYNRISRMLTHILVGYQKKDNKNLNIEYIKILGFNNNGKKYLNKIKKEIKKDLISKNIYNKYKQLDIENNAELIYQLIINNNNKEKILFKSE